MSPIDSRRPADVTDDFRDRLSRQLAPFGFEPRAKGAALVRREGKTTFRIELSSSYRNIPGDVTCWVALQVQDTEIRKIDSNWRAGGSLGGPAFAETPPTNIADSDQAEALLQRIQEGLDFFKLISRPEEVCREVSRRYVPGLIEPSTVVPYLHVRLGSDAAKHFATSLLHARQELWPAFMASIEPTKVVSVLPDHGTLLLRALRKCGLEFGLAAPPDAARCTDLSMANLRCFVGRQLRAWGERDAACGLYRISDERLRELRQSQEGIRTAVTRSPQSAGLALRMVTGEARDPRREVPIPRLFQYHALMEPFA